MSMHLAAKIPHLCVVSLCNTFGITCDFRLDMRNFISQSASLFLIENINITN